jgi:hypothetical protein
MPDRALLEFKTTPCNTYAATPGGLGTNCSLLSTLAEIRKRISHNLSCTLLVRLHVLLD